MWTCKKKHFLKTIMTLFQIFWLPDKGPKLPKHQPFLQGLSDLDPPLRLRPNPSIIQVIW
jgi:hypothetical protein